MSLVGSLEDLSLGDILQIISLSQKSGVLALDTTGAAGRIVFVNGLVRSAAVKGGPVDLRSLLVGGGFVAADDFAAAAAHAASSHSDLKSTLAELGVLPGERIDSLCREAIESAVATMFSWTKGDFSFDVRSEPIAGDPELLSPEGINAQYLAMECARVRDEGGGETGVPGAADGSASFDEMSAHEMFGVAPDQAGATRAPESETANAKKPDGVGLSDRATALAAEILALAAAVEETGDSEEARDDGDDGGVVETLDLDARIEPDEDTAGATSLDSTFDEPEPAVASASAATAPPAPAPSAARSSSARRSAAAEPVATAPAVEPGADADAPRPLVVVDGDLVALEWVKQALHEDFDPIHIFPKTEPAMGRIRQYLVRGRPPVVLIAPRAPVDRLGGVTDAVDFVARLKAQSPRVVVLWLREEGGGAVGRMGAADGVVVRPESARLRDAKAAVELSVAAAEFADQVRSDVSGGAREASARAEAKSAISPDALRRLRDATRALTEASSRGEVLPLVMRFASETFSRVAMFLVRDGTAVGMAQHGLAGAGGPDDRELRELAYPCASSSWMAMVLESGKAVRGAAGNDGDRAFAGLLGERVPDQAYLAPIQSTGQVIALLYGDNLPDERPLGDTSALEVVLHHAGLALDRAALERALRESER